MNFPQRRLRRLRETAPIREMARDVFLSPEQFIQPVFVHGKSENEPISTMPGIERIAVKNIKKEVEKIKKTGIKGILLFPLPDENLKDPEGSIATSKGQVSDIISATKEAAKEMVLFTDLCLCPFTDHGHCGIIHDNKIDNDSTLIALGKAAATFAEAGSDFVAPSGMMDGMVDAIRKSLDAHGYASTGILSYSIKFASHFYGPFREAAHSSPGFGDRKSYQMDFRSAKQIEAELKQDIHEGCDAVMVKPGLPYLDAIRQVRELTDLPLAVYQVSGEYSSLMTSGQAGILDERQAFEETFYAFRRAGADWVITYYGQKYWS